MRGDVPVLEQLDRSGGDGDVDGRAGPSVPGGLGRAGEADYSGGVGEPGHR
jgi:hypothetical protein